MVTWPGWQGGIICNGSCALEATFGPQKQSIFAGRNDTQNDLGRASAMTIAVSGDDGDGSGETEVFLEGETARRATTRHKAAVWIWLSKRPRQREIAITRQSENRSSTLFPLPPVATPESDQHPPAKPLVAFDCEPILCRAPHHHSHTRLTPSRGCKYTYTGSRAPTPPTMNTSTPIPVAIFGKDLKIAESVQEKLLPDIESRSPLNPQICQVLDVCSIRQTRPDKEISWI